MNENLTFVHPILLKNLKGKTTDIDIFLDWHKIFRNFVISDRTNHTSLPFSLSNTEHNFIHEFSISNNSFIQASIDTANLILENKKPIYLFWSGGIDSTAMVSSFMMSDNFMSDKITIVCNFESIQEYPKFYDQHVKNQFNFISTEKFMQMAKFQKIDGIIVEANPAETFFGDNSLTTGFMKLFGKEIFFKNYSREYFIEFCVFHKMNKFSAECLFDFICHTIKKSPIEIKTMFQFGWWAGYNLLWTFVLGSTKSRMLFHNNVRYFFNELPLNIWIYNNLEPFEYPYQYKSKILKNLIFEFNNDVDYYENKNKHVSISRRFLTYPNLLETNLNSYDHGKNLINFYNNENFITQWIKNK